MPRAGGRLAGIVGGRWHDAPRLEVTGEEPMSGDEVPERVLRMHEDDPRWQDPRNRTA